MHAGECLEADKLMRIDVVLRLEAEEEPAVIEGTADFPLDHEGAFGVQEADLEAEDALIAHRTIGFSKR